jgi:hypothetical protein
MSTLYTGWRWYVMRKVLKKNYNTYKTFMKKGYSKRDINHALKPEIKQKTNKEKPVRTSLLPY